MGIYVNPCNIEYRRAINDDVYIDKTGLIACTNSRLGKASRFMCVSRPRRFGKSMAADMLTAYYCKRSDSRELFAGKTIEKDPSYEKHLNRYHVIRIDVQQFIYSREEIRQVSEEIRRAVIEELLEEFPECTGITTESGLQTALNKIFSYTGEGFIFIIDEWDCVFRMAQDDEKAQRLYLDFIRNLFKGAIYAELVYMTGILPIKKYGEHSAVNMFAEYSMTSPKNLGTYFGFTAGEVRSECSTRGICYEEMKKWYDGYLLEGTHIYNPKSAADAFRWGKFANYWTGTETYEALKVYIDENFDGLKEAVVGMLGGARQKINVRHFQNDMTTFKSKDDILTLLVHLGYLTYDERTEEVFIPNREIEEEFLNAVDGSCWDGLRQALNQSMELLERTWAMDSAAVAKGIDEIHDETTSMLQYNNENSLSCVIYMAYYSAAAYYARPISELPTGKGYADIVYLPRENTDKPALVVELKWDKTAEGAIRQIKEKNYTRWLEGFTGNILLIGINYDKKTKQHTCAIERFVKDEKTG